MDDIDKMSDQEQESSQNLLRNGIKPKNVNKTNNGSMSLNGVSSNNGEKYYYDYQKLHEEFLRLRRYLYGLTVISIFGIVILIIVVAILFANLSHDVANHSHQPKVGEEISKMLEREELCISCENIKLGPSVEEDKMLDTFIRKHDPDSHDGEQCCVETSKQLLTMLELVENKQEYVGQRLKDLNFPYTDSLQFFQDGARIEAAFKKYFHRADPKQKTDSYEIFVCHANVIRYFQESSQNLLRNGIKPKIVNKTNNGSMSLNGVSSNNGEKYYYDYQKLHEEFLRLRRYLYGLTVIFIFGVPRCRQSFPPTKVGEEISKMLEREELCISCENIKLGPSVEEDKMLDTFIRKHDPDSHDGEQCCVETSKQLLTMLELFIEKRYRQEMARGNIKIPVSPETESDRPAAHLMGSVSRLDQDPVPGQQFPISSWIYDVDLAFTNRVEYRHGRIVVPSDGLYYVYSQVSFLEFFRRGNTASFGNSLSHYIYRYNIIYSNGGEENLIQNSITKCWGRNQQFGEYTSYLGALFYLRKGDELFVKVSNLTLVAREPKLNYFGLFKLS
ncbi:hypothetical protein KUTeg_008982 [Tegillarca granosa]|uniref:THD domain-containing protein n=1 Tax=Tegillarca granosa TaxID=220873 RepID=A0ABQ9F7V9_TEGGR|nr:hypothetical protein KUTeg_008982 [Tegillarca granosa]